MLTTFLLNEIQPSAIEHFGLLSKSNDNSRFKRVILLLPSYGMGKDF